MVSLPVYALCFGLFSAASLPLGAIIGMVFSPISEVITGRFMALGSGAVVYAVATQLYGDALCRFRAAYDEECYSVSSDEAEKAVRFFNLNLQVFAGVGGALIYYLLNKWLQNLAAGPEQLATDSNNEASVVTAASMQTVDPGDLHNARATSADAGSSFHDERAEPSDELRRAQSWHPNSVSSPSQFALTRTISGTQRELFQHTFSRMPALLEGYERSKRRLSQADLSVPLSSSDADGPVPPVALSMWLGVTLDGIPEALMLGFMTNEGTISWQFLIAIFMANFPEAFSSSSLLRASGVSRRTIMVMWTSVFVMTGLLAMLGSAMVPATTPEDSVLGRVRTTGTAFLEGLTGGAMLAMISTAMIPEAFHGAGDLSGSLFVVGFVLSCALDGIGIRYGGPTTI